MLGNEDTESETPMFTLRGIDVAVPDLGSKGLRVEASAGIHVLYGLNGVGKTRILNAIEHGTFSLHAPIAAHGHWSPLWHMTRGWSFGHEHELDWQFKDDWVDEGSRASGDVLDVEALVDENPEVLLETLEEIREILDGYHVKNLVDRRFLWTARIAYWVARVHRLKPADRRLVVEAIREFIEQGDVVIRQLSEDETRGASQRWYVTHYATVTPDAPHLYAWQQWAANAMKEVAYDKWAEVLARGSGSWEWCFDDFLWDVEPRLIPDAAYAAVPVPAGAQPLENQGPRFEVFGRELDFAENWSNRAFRPIDFLTDDHLQIDDETMAYLRRAVDTSEDFDATKPPGGFDRNPRRMALEAFMFGTVDSPQFHLLVVSLAEDLGERASVEFSNLLATATPLRARLIEPGEWATHGRMRWESLDRRGSWVPLADLSDTQRRLATLAIKIAMYAPSDAVSILLIDEPERGLHRIAERHLVAGLSELTRRYPDLVTIVASHSPSFLRPDLATLHHVERNAEGVVQINRMPAVPSDALTKLGMSTSDLLQLTRIVILVEGQHDEWVLRHMFGEEFDAMGVKVMSMRGATKLISAADGTLLFDYTEAHLIVMLDRTQQERIDRLWNDALVSWKDDPQVGKVVDILDKLLPTPKKPSSDRVNGKTEGAALRDFCTAVIKQDRHDRISFAGMEADDIEDYFSPKYFTTGENPPASFKALRAEWSKRKGAGEDVGQFKKWARATHGMSFSERNFKRAVQNSDLPADFQNLFKIVSNLSELLA